MLPLLSITGYIEDASGRRGSAGAGKDTVADAIVEHFAGIKVGLGDEMKRICKKIYDFSDEQLWGPSEMRNAPDHRYPLPGPESQESREAWERFHQEKTTSPALVELEALGWLSPRRALQQLGEWGRDNSARTWTSIVIQAAQELDFIGRCYSPRLGVIPRVPRLGTPPCVVVNDVRYPDELVAFAEVGGMGIRVKRRVEILDNSVIGHPSEKALLGTPDSAFDVVIDNDGTPEDLELKVLETIESVLDKWAQTNDR